MTTPPAARYFQGLLEHAHDLGASDIHIEPLEQGFQVRMRVDGRLRRVAQITDDVAFADDVLGTIKAEVFDSALQFRDQAGRCEREHPPADYRGALFVCKRGDGLGEKMVLRVLQRDQTFDLASYRMDEVAKRDLVKALGKANGLIVTSGPTGSGKSTLLYNAMAALDREQLAVYTTEDPVEYTLQGLVQGPVDRGRGQTFAERLRTLMRADPDVIYVGEIRDQETADVAVHAATTGHLVLTTTHATSVAAFRHRMTAEWGVSGHLLEETVRWAGSQVLVRTLCPDCRVPDPSGAERLQRVFGEALEAYRGEGCPSCAGTGERGRRLLLEWAVRVDQPDGSSVLELQTTLRDQVRTAVTSGAISVREGLKAI